jgi:heme exporter protein C
MTSLRYEKWLALAAAGTLVGAMYGALLYAPTERTMGDIQRIFYVHMPCWIVGFAAYLVSSGSGAAYLATKNMKWDRLAVSCAEVGTLFITGGLITGPVWAKPVWGVWWVWDPRLTLALLNWLIYVSYLLLRDFIEEPLRRATVSGIYGIFAFGSVIFNYLAIRLWRTQHPQPVVGGGPESGLDPQMYQVLLLSMIAFMIVFVLLAILRVRLEESRAAVQQLRRQVMLQS